MEQAHQPATNNHINRYERLGTCRSIIPGVGIILQFYLRRPGTAFGPFDTRSLEKSLLGLDTTRSDFSAPNFAAFPRLATALPPGGTKRFEVSLAAARYRLAPSSALGPERLGSRLDGADLPLQPVAGFDFENPSFLPFFSGTALP